MARVTLYGLGPQLPIQEADYFLMADYGLIADYFLNSDYFLIHFLIHFLITSCLLITA